MAHTKYGKRSLRHLGPKIWHKIDPSFVHDSSQLTFKKQYRDVLISAYDDRVLLSISMVLKYEFFMSTVYHFILPIAHINFKLYISL